LQALQSALTLQEQSDYAKEAAVQRQQELDDENAECRREVASLTNSLHQMVSDKNSLEADFAKLTQDHDSITEHHRGLRELHDNHKAGTEQQLENLREQIDASQTEIERNVRLPFKPR
jgi:predicted nuclease with TOPRIM domain